MNLTELAAVLGWLVVGANVIAIVILLGRLERLERRVYYEDRYVHVRGVKVRIDDLLGDLTRRLKLDLVHEPESVRLVDEETRR